MFIWEPGDGLDVISGGDDGDDRFEFRGRGTAGDILTLAADNGHVDAEFFNGTLCSNRRRGCRILPAWRRAMAAPADVVIEDLFETEVTTIDVELPVAGLLDDVDD